jgi:hypothetical protein
MNKKSILTIAGLALAAGVATPYITKTSIEHLIQNQQQQLSNIGIAFKVIKDEGFLKSQRDITIKFTDPQKLLEYLAQNSQISIQELNKLTNNGVLLEETSFKGEITNSNIFPKKIHMQLIPDQLPSGLQKAMQKEPSLQKLITSLKLILDFNTDGKLTYATLNDIVIKDHKNLFKVTKPEITLLNNQHYKSSINNITLNINEHRETIFFYVDTITSDNIQKSPLDIHSVTKIKKIKYTYAKRYHNASYESDNNSFSSSVNSDNNSVNTLFEYKLNNIAYKARRVNLGIKDFDLRLSVNGLSKAPLLDIANNTGHKNYTQKEMEAKLQEIANNGFTIALHTDIKDMKFHINRQQFNSQTLQCNLTANIPKNSFNKRSRQRDIMRKLTLKGNIVVDEALVQAIPPLRRYDTNVTNGLANFAIELKNQRLYVNKHILR